MIVARDGKVFPCCSDWDRTYEIGDANDRPLKEIWKGERMETLRDGNRAGNLDDFDPCRECFVLSSYEWRPMTEAEKSERDALLAKTNEQQGRVVRIGVDEEIAARSREDLVKFVAKDSPGTVEAAE